MPAHIVRRKTAAGEPRYHVRATIGGRKERGGRLLHLGAFRTKREADKCVEWANLELAQGRIPDRRTRLRDAHQARTLREAALAWVASRRDLADATRASYLVTVERSEGSNLDLWNLPTTRINLADLRRFVAALEQRGVSPTTIRRELNVVRQTLDHEDVSPNPARDKRLKLPRKTRVAPDPPTLREVVAILENSSSRFRLPIALLEATGLRISELLGIQWGDVDVAENRFRVATGKTKAARRFVDVPAELMGRVCLLCPLEDREATRRVFRGIGREHVGEAMRRACKIAQIPLYSPHDLRHRHISRRVLLGEPITTVQRDAGHARASLTLDVYSHVMVDTNEAWRHVDF